LALQSRREIFLVGPRRGRCDDSRAVCLEARLDDLRSAGAAAICGCPCSSSRGSHRRLRWRRLLGRWDVLTITGWMGGGGWGLRAFRTLLRTYRCLRAWELQDVCTCVRSFSLRSRYNVEKTQGPGILPMRLSVDAYACTHAPLLLNNLPGGAVGCGICERSRWVVAVVQ
jgi:hypothetical protein